MTMFNELRVAIVLEYSYWASGYGQSSKFGSNDTARRCTLLSEAGTAVGYNAPASEFADCLAALY
jgi:hypothetical protein